MPVGAPILAPGKVKILALEPNWYAGQPLVYFELLDGPDAGRVQYVAEQITNIAPVGILQQGQAIATRMLCLASSSRSDSSSSLRVCCENRSCRLALPEKIWLSAGTR